MIITSQGFGHFTGGINNQDFGIETERSLLILDGCSAAKHSEVGVRLFSQLLSRKEDWDNVEKFEDNVKAIFDDIIAMMRKYYPEQEKLEKEFIMENLLFTIIACFKTENEFIVKFLGDGYIITKNNKGLTSFVKLYYGIYPPYFAYNYCKGIGKQKFRTHIFEKERFKNVAISTDGIMPIAKGTVKGFDDFLKAPNKLKISNGIDSQRQFFQDDITIGILEGL